MSYSDDDPTGLDINGRCADPTCACQLWFAKRSRRRSFWRGFRDGLASLWYWLRKER